MGGGKGKPPTGGAAAHRMEKLGTRMIRGTGGIQREAMAQGLEALRTGGVGAQIPIIQRAVGQQKRATSQALRAIESQTNLAGTPFGQAIMAQTRLAGRQAQAMTPIELAQMAMDRGLGVAGQRLQAGTGVMGGFAGLQQAITAGHAAILKARMQEISQGAQKGASEIFGGMGGAMCDERLKTDMVPVGLSPEGHTVYEFSFTMVPGRYRGVVAQEVREVAPEAVFVSPLGYLAVDYNKLDVQFEVLDGTQ